MDIQHVIQLIWPLILIQLAFQIYALIDLIVTKKHRTKNLSFVVWVIIIIFGEILGAVLYFIIGRSDK